MQQCCRFPKAKSSSSPATPSSPACTFSRRSAGHHRLQGGRRQPLRSRRQGRAALCLSVERGLTRASVRRPGSRPSPWAYRRRKTSSGIALVGGDTCATLGPLTITVTAIGMLPQGEAVLRRGAMAGDRLYVSGTIGDAALGLKLLRTPGLAGGMGSVGRRGCFSRRSLSLPLGAQRTCLAAASMRPRGDRRLRRARRRYDEALQRIRRQRHDRGSARAAFACRRKGGRQRP